MAAPMVPRALRVAGGSRARCCRPLGSASGADAGSGSGAEQARLLGRRHKEERRRLRREREAGGGGGEQPPPPPPKAWRPKPVVEYELPLDPDGKKATGGPLPPSYSPRYVEAAWGGWWERSRFFTPPPPQNWGETPKKETPEEETPKGATPKGGTPRGGGRVLSLVLPPPNVTGRLHVGHALGVALQDALVRWRRMQGWAVLWLPGTDHAGIATQAAVERWLWQQRGLRRQELSRAQFLAELWAWKERHGGAILQQLRALGASLDWSRCAFTMDPGFSRAVSEAFVRLHGAGLVRRARRLVNWSCALRCALADVEVEPRVLAGPTVLSGPGWPRAVTFGVLVRFAYPVEGDDELELPVATTRPETMLGDVAVAVHPGDPRYQHLHGRHVRHPFTGQLLPIITDPSVEPELGTGAVKVTPGHGHPDLALARAHRLPPPRGVIGDDGTVRPPGGGWLQGAHRFDARERLVAALAMRGLFRGCQDHPMTLPLCSRSGDVVELLLKSQWFLRCREMAQRARQAVTSGRLQLVPKFHEKNWKTWMDNAGDWCLSRQLWWGHQVPAYRVGAPPPENEDPPENGDPPAGEDPPEGLWVVGRSEDEARAAAARLCRCPPADIQLHRDPDVLDTWFSSALFPFAALGWPDETPDLRRFYPTSLLETGSDLLFFWVARMVMLGQELTGRLPFSQVLLHSLVRDAQGRKMSKSLGNVIDPRDVIAGASLQELQEKLQRSNLDPHELAVASEGQRRQFPHGIPECGTDALRMALCSHNAHGDDIRLDVATVLSYRHFCNKVWNAVKFVLAALGPGFVPQPPEEAAPRSPMERWVLSRLARAAGDYGRRMEALEAHGALAAAHHFWLRSFCDVYLEAAKPALRGPGEAADTRQTLLSCAELGLRLLAPFAPFLAEELWHRLPRASPASPTICLAPFPDAAMLAHWCCPEVEAEVEAMREVARAVRALRETFRLGAARPHVAVRCPEEMRAALQELGPALQALAQAGPLRLLPQGAEPTQGAEPELGPGWVGAPAGPGTHVYLCLQGLVEPRAERSRLSARSRSLQRRLQALGGDTAPPSQQRQVASIQAELARLAQALQALGPPEDAPPPPIKPH